MEENELQELLIDTQKEYTRSNKVKDKYHEKYKKKYNEEYTDKEVRKLKEQNKHK